MSPAAPTRPDATINATDEATAPPLDDALAARDEAPATPRATGTRVDAGRSAEIAAAFDELAPVYDRLTTILSLGLDRRWRSAVVAETRLTPGDSAIDVAAGTGRLATELADRVGPFGRIVALDLSPAMVERGTARSRDIVQLEFVLGDALELPFDDGRFGAATIALGSARWPTRSRRSASCAVSSDPAAASSASSRRCPGQSGGAASSTGRPTAAPLAVSVAARGDAYRRLGALTRNVPDADSLADLLRAAGLVDVRYRRLGLGAVAIHAGSLPPG